WHMDAEIIASEVQKAFDMLHVGSLEKFSSSVSIGSSSYGARSYTSAGPSSSQATDTDYPSFISHLSDDTVSISRDEGECPICNNLFSNKTEQQAVQFYLAGSKRELSPYAYCRTCATTHLSNTKYKKTGFRDPLSNIPIDYHWGGEINDALCRNMALERIGESMRAAYRSPRSVKQ
ncbi:hypothetical protein, partial [Sansalvadorimonas verongulae]|uniref:hypothetical protein n=1 Tax=Sansalvadorimonas verongulae TaxID=2172824 RepID=UPI001E31BA33